MAGNSGGSPPAGEGDRKPPVRGKPWDDFWSGAEGKPAGCLPGRGPGIEQARAAAWQAFARSLPRSARVLDIATGDGQVLADLLGPRRDLKATGVDLAPRLPPPPRGGRIMPGVAMETLPFKDGSYAAVTSQFGIEYGDLDRTAAEISRVLRRRGALAMLLHHPEGIVLRHNRARAEGLRWVIDESGIFAQASAGLALRVAGLAVPPAVKMAMNAATRRYGAGSGGWELCAAVVQTLELGAHASAESIRSTLATLSKLAGNEIARVSALETACRAIADRPAFDRRFTDAGLMLRMDQTLIDDTTGLPFGSFRTFAKP